MTHEERKTRRTEIARAIADGETAEDVASRFGVSVGMIRMACIEHGIRIPRLLHGNQLVTPQEWGSVDWSKRDIDIAREFGISRERVRQIRRKMNQPDPEDKRFGPVAIAFRRWANDNRNSLAGLQFCDVCGMFGNHISYSLFKRIFRNLGIEIVKRTVRPSITKENLRTLVDEIPGPLPTPCWKWAAREMGNGYGRISRRTYAHRFVFELFNGPTKDGNWVLHKCDNPMCVNPIHLYEGTAKDNARDRVLRGRNGTNKMTAEQVLEARRLFIAGGQSYASLAKKYGVTPQAMRCAIVGKTWNYAEQQVALEASA